MAERDARREEAYRRWLAVGWGGRRPPSRAAWRDAVAVYRAVRSGVREAGELERVTGLSPARCARAARLVESLLSHLLAADAAGPSPAPQTEGDARPQ